MHISKRLRLRRPGCNARGYLGRATSVRIIPKCDLSGAFLEAADLRNTNLRGTCLRGAELRGARLSGAFFDSDTKWPQHFTRENAIRVGAIALDRNASPRSTGPVLLEPGRGGGRKSSSPA